MKDEQLEGNFTDTSRKDIKAVTDGIKVYIERHCWSKMNGWCKAAKSEVSGMGLCKLEDGVFKVYDVFLPKQNCTSAYTELDDMAQNRLAYRLRDKANDFRFWWHTHYNFNTFWSGTDNMNAQRLMKANGEWELSLVINQAGDSLCRLDMEKPINITLDNLQCFLIPNSKKRKRKRNFKTDIKRWVHLPKPVVYKHTPNNSYIPGVNHSFDYEAWKKEQIERQKKWDEEYEERKTAVQSKFVPGNTYVLYEGRFMTQSQKEALQKTEREEIERQKNIEIGDGYPYFWRE